MWRVGGGGTGNAYGILIWKQQVTYHLEDRGPGERIILKLILKWHGKEWSRLMWLRIGTVCGFV